jgi:hypothetical protein
LSPRSDSAVSYGFGLKTRAARFTGEAKNSVGAVVANSPRAFQSEARSHCAVTAPDWCLDSAGRVQNGFDRWFSGQIGL